jgi:hypothetical protein
MEITPQEWRAALLSGEYSRGIGHLRSKDEELILHGVLGQHCRPSWMTREDETLLINANDTGKVTIDGKTFKEKDVVDWEEGSAVLKYLDEVIIPREVGS